ncbi:hypothetical protein ACHAWX_000144 [Stephanocyclus meneghinianus]
MEESKNSHYQELVDCINQFDLPYMCVRGIDADDEDKEDEVDYEDVVVDEDEVDKLHFIFVTDERGRTIEEVRKLVLKDKYPGGFLMFNTSFSYDVLEAFELVKDRFNRTKSWPKKFDLLLGFTHAIKEFDYWLNDHEVGWGGEIMVKKLGQMWRRVLAKSNDDLGIDGEFSRPGVVYLLGDFKEMVEDIETYGIEPAMKFPFA